MITVVGNRGCLVPGLAAVVGAGEDHREFLRFAAHDVGTNAQPSIGQIEDAVRLKAHDGGLLGRRPGVAVVMAPVEPVARRLILVEVAVVVVIDDHDEAAVVEAAESRRTHSLFALAQVSLIDFAVFEPGAPAIIAGEQRKDLIFLRPMRVGVGKDQHEAT